MKQVRTLSGQCLAAVLAIVISVSAYGCGDSASVSEDVTVPLASLTVTPSTSFRPTFSSNTTNYTVEVPTSASSVTVAAVPKDSTATVTIDGAITSQRSIPLDAPGSTKTITILVESLAGEATTYTLAITRLLSGDNNLSALTVTVGPATQPLSPRFAADTLSYTVNVQTSAASVTITATKSDSTAVMQIGSVAIPAGAASGQATIRLNEPGTPTPITIEVTAPNGSKKSYRLTINRLSGDNNLSALSVLPHALAPAFAANTVLYDVNVATDVRSVTVSATKSDSNAVMQVHSVTVPAGTASGQDTVQLTGPGTDTSISVIVIAQNGVDQKTYTIRVHRAAPSSNNNLATLTVTPGSLAPPFAPDIVGYRVDVATNDNSVTATATLQDPTATMLINGQGTSSGQPREISPLQPPGSDTIITIVVRAQNGDEKPYTITVRRPLPLNDNYLSALSLTADRIPLDLIPLFDRNQLNYTAQAPFGVFVVTVTATKSDPNAVIFGSVTAGAGIPTGQADVLTFLPPPQVSITVLAPDGSSKIYTVVITQASPPFP